MKPFKIIYTKIQYIFSLVKSSLLKILYRFFLLQNSNSKLLYTLDNRFINKVDIIPDNFTGIVKLEHGANFWYLNGKLHREDGPAFFDKTGHMEWFLKGKRHRFNGPAVIYMDLYSNKISSEYWYLNDKFHRLDGPACEWHNGTKEWYLNGKPMSEEQYNLLRDIIRLKGLQ